MRFWSKTIVALTLICYVAVSGVASTHAFASSQQNSQSTLLSLNKVDLSGDTAMNSHCDQSKVDNTTSSSSICKIFCAAISNIIIEDNYALISSIGMNDKIAFNHKNTPASPISMEPTPPK